MLLPVWPLPRSLATTSGISVDFFSSPYLDVSVQAVPLVNLWIQSTIHGLFPCGFPHSEICGLTLICSSPQLIAAYRVLHRLPVPRHSPCVLSNLTKLANFSSLNYMATSFQCVLPLTLRKNLQLSSNLFVFLFVAFSFSVQFSMCRFPTFLKVVEMRRFELLTPCLQGRCSPI